MMTIYQRMAAVFRRAGVPGFLQAWQKTREYPEIPDKFCAYVVERVSEALSGDDRPKAMEYAVSLHLFGRADVSDERDMLEAALLDAGFFIPCIRDLDDVRAGEYIYHKRFDLTYYEFL